MDWLLLGAIAGACARGDVQLPALLTADATRAVESRSGVGRPLGRERQRVVYPPSGARGPVFELLPVADWLVMAFWIGQSHMQGHNLWVWLP